MKKFLYIIVAFVLAFSPTLVFGTNKNTKQTHVRKEKKDSLAILTEKATKGDAVSQNILGVWYYTGRKVKQEYKIALDWWAKSAKQDNPDAIGNMAMCYQLGNGIKKDSVMALSLYKAAIKKGNVSIIPQHEQIAKNAKSLFSVH